MQEDRALMQLGAPVNDLVGGQMMTATEVRVPRSLTAREKAAIVVRLVISEGADIPLEDLPEDLQEKLTQQMGQMGLVDRITLDAVAAEFADALEGIGLAFPHGLAGALSAMDGKIAPTTAARLRKEAGVRQIGNPWQRLRGLDAMELAEIAQAESTEVAAVLLSKIETAKAAELLSKLPGPLARKITFAVSQTGSVTPEAVERIGWSLAKQLDDKPISAFEDGPDKRVGAILNQSTAATREDVLESLDQEDAAFATSVRKEIFTFAHIPRRLSARDVPAVIRQIEQGDLIVAMAAAVEGADAESKEFMLTNMSGRMADNLRDEVTEMGTVKQSEGEEAMNRCITAIRQLEMDGVLDLVVEEED